MAQSEPPYPVQFSVDYPDQPRDRFTCFFRLLFVIPIGIVISVVSEAMVIPPLLLILFRQKYPRWWFDWNVALLRFESRVSAYFLLLRDEYPSTDEEQSVHLEISYPDVEADLNRWLPLVKWILAIPHYVVLVILSLIGFFVLIISWLAILVTGRYPHGMFNYVVGVARWYNRVWAYAFILTTDLYPPFRLSP
ncbi:MAG: hypothetical protein BZY88_04920 [SAR202 cluster bacterium Io17-Chloro-G9]|nr:MAG: hypothetical protein BZY88_04920 [SAR202 cluster bacterium Io17-Chloro-G9]